MRGSPCAIHVSPTRRWRQNFGVVNALAPPLGHVPLPPARYVDIMQVCERWNGCARAARRIRCRGARWSSLDGRWTTESRVYIGLYAYVEREKKARGIVSAAQQNGVGCENTIARVYVAGARKCFEYNGVDNEDVFDACASHFSLSPSLFSLLCASLIRFNCKSYIWPYCFQENSYD